MPTEPPSRRFMRVYNTLPLEAKQALVEKHLANLLDHTPKDTYKKVYSATSQLQTHYKNAPKLDLRGKRKQVNSLLEALVKDSKVSFIKERTNREEILAEIVDSLTNWLNDIWTVVFEYNVNFELAHRCLLFAANALIDLYDGTGVGGCKCAIMNLPVGITIKDKNGRIVKRTRVKGPQNVDRVLLWIWRDLFLSMSAKGTKDDKDIFNEMLEDIESVFGFVGLERLLYGGKKYDEDDEDEDEDDPEFEDESCDEDGDDDYDYDSDCPYRFQARHWPDKLNHGRQRLMDRVEAHLFNLFQTTPSLALYNTIMAISEHDNETQQRISGIITDMAGSTSETLVAALDIQVANCNARKIISLLDTHSHLLRPRDFVTLRCAAAVLGDSSFHARGLSLLETELNDCLHAIYIAILGSFSHFEEAAHKKELTDILKLRSGSQSRRDRIETWAEAVMTSSLPPFHPMAFAAMMMGLPMVPGMEEGEDSDVLSYMDIDQSDPDLEDLREEFRPKLKQRFQDWTQLASVMKGGVVASAKLYAKATEQMPFLRSHDVVAEMLSRLGGRPSKGYVCDALEALSTFCKAQRKRFNALKKEQEKRAAAAVTTSKLAISTGTNTASGGRATSEPSPASGSSSTPPPLLNDFTFAFSPTASVPPNTIPRYLPPHLPFPLVPGGMEDVD